MDERKPVSKLLRDKLILVGLALVIVSPVAVYFAVRSSRPAVSDSAKHLLALPKSEQHVVTRALKDDDLEALSRFDDLRDLELHFSDITDAGMPRIAGHKGLRRLVLHALAVTDAGVGELAALNELEELYLIGCVEVTSKGLEFLASLPALRAIVLNQCIALDDSIAGTLAACSALRSIEFESIRSLSDRTCELLATRTDIVKLGFDMSPRIGAEGIRQLSQIKSLEWLSLHGLDTLDDSVLPVFEDMPNLKYLQLPVRGNFTSDGLERLKAALPGCEIHHGKTQ